jgi:hypothetical protein
MPQPAVAADFDQPLDIHLHLTAQIAFHFISLRDEVTHNVDFTFRQVFHPDIGINFGRSQNNPGTARTDPKQIAQSYLNPLISRKINTFNSCHISSPLTLLVFWILADHI